MKSLDEKETWQAALGELEVTFSKANFSTWFQDTYILEMTDEKVIIAVPHSFAQEWLENKYHPEILKTLKKIQPNIKTIQYKVALVKAIKNLPKNEEVIEVENKATAPEPEKQNFAFLKPHYTFNNFIIGNSNRLAVATAQAVTQKPGTVYNPLFIYGGVGLGKTHLMQAIGNEIAKNHPKKKMVYVSCEKFTNDYIDSIKNKKINEFKKNYRDADVLMVDDIQFMSGKEGTQEEFFHTFNVLHHANRQIIVTSDKVPKAIPRLAERLSSRFGWGMVADIQPPNLEMRQAILQSKCEEKNCQIDPQVLNYIAQNIESNIRELEGAINRILSFAELNNEAVSLELAKSALDDIIQSKGQNLSIEKIFSTTTEYFQISLDDLVSTKRNQELVRPRQIVMYLLRHEMNLSYPKISQHLNKKDHTTIIHGVEKIEKEISRDEELSKQLQLLKEKIRNT
jgi:chromosomal replication initiator protein